MDRKNRIWLIVLLVLFVAAIIGVIVVRGQLTASQANYVEASTRLADEQENTAAMQTELDAAKAAAESLTADLEASRTEAASLAEELEQEKAKVAELESKLPDAAYVSELETALEAAETRTAELETDLQTAQARTAELEADLQTAEARTAELEADLQTKQARVAELEQELEDAALPVPQSDATTAPESDPESDATAAPEDDPVDLPEVDVAGLATRVEEIKNGDLSDEEKLAAIESLENQLSAGVEQLNRAADEIASRQETLDAAEAELAQMRGNLTEAETSISDLEARLAADAEEIASLQAQIEAMKAQSETDATALAGLEAQLAAVREDYERRLSELQAYLLSRELTDGQAFASTDAASTIHVSADGETAVWFYTNRAISGNSVVLSVVLDGVELYRSEPVAPGERIEHFTLSEKLSAGTYSAMAVTAAQDAQGETLFSSRVPVEIEVAE